MARLTDQLSGVNSGKGIVNPGPASPSGIGALADFASGAVNVFSRVTKERQAQQNEATMDELAGRIFDIQTGANRAVSQEAPVSAPTATPDNPFPNIAPLDGELQGGPDSAPAIPQEAVSAATDLNRMQRGVQQGRVSQAAYDMQLERLQAEFFQKFPDQRAEIAAYFQSRGLEHYMFRAFREEKAAYENEQTAQARADQTQFDYAASRGLVTSNTSLEDGARIGREAMAAQAQIEAAKERATAIRENQKMDREEREAALKASGQDAVNGVITQIGVAVQPLMDQTALAISGAGTDAERQTVLAEYKTQALAALSVAEQRAYVEVAAAGGSEDARKAVREMFGSYRESINTLYTSSFEANTMAMKNMQASFNLTAGRAAPMYNRVVSLIGQPAANALFGDPQGFAQLAPEVVESVKREMNNFDPSSERGTVSLARMIGYMRGEVGLQDLQPNEAAQYVRANGASLLANQRAVVGGDMSAINPWMTNYANMTEAMVELGPTTTTAAGLKTATGYVATPAARQVLDQARKQDPEYGAALTQASRAASARGLEIGRTLPDSGIFKSRYNEQTGRFEATLSRADYDRWRGNADQVEGVAAAFGAAPGLASGQRVPTYEEMRRRVPQDLNDKLIVLNANLEHLVQTDKYDPAIPSGVTPKERRSMYATGTIPESMRSAGTDGTTQQGEWDRMVGNLDTTIQNLLVGTTSRDLPRPNSGLSSDPNSLDWVVRTIYGEASGEGPAGWAPVAATIFNRATAGNFGGNTYRDVVLARNQFEPWSNASARRRMENLDPNSKEYKEIEAVAQQILEDRGQYANYTHFYAPKAQAALGRRAPNWDDGSGVDIGNHRFFVNPGRRSGG